MRTIKAFMYGIQYIPFIPHVSPLSGYGRTHAHPIPPSNSSQWSFSPHWSFTSENILVHLTLPPSFASKQTFTSLPCHLRPLVMAVSDSSYNLILNVLSEEPCHDTMLQFCCNCSKNITFHNQYQSRNKLRVEHVQCCNIILGKSAVSTIALAMRGPRILPR